MKTIAQAAEEYANNEKRTTNSLAAAFIDGAEFAQRWISIEDELPEREGEFNPDSLFVLVRTNIDFIRIALYSHRQNKWFVPGGKQFDKTLGKINYWRPIYRK